jgi:hypothetical protein
MGMARLHAGSVACGVGEKGGNVAREDFDSTAALQSWPTAARYGAELLHLLNKIPSNSLLSITKNAAELGPNERISDLPQRPQG